MRLRISRLLFWCVVLSIVFHFTIVPLLVWLLRAGHFVPPAPKELVYVRTSSALRISHVSHPRPPKPRVQPQPALAQHQVAVQRAQGHMSRPRTQPRREIARIDPRALRIAPPKVTYSRPTLDTAQQQQQFEKTIARLREQSDPVIGAARPVKPATTIKRYAFDFSGSLGTAPRGEGILTPEESWHDGGYDYYYVRYWVQYPDGTTETGHVPWPLRYRPSQDPFRLGIEHFPLPVPLPDFSLPAGTVLHPLVAYCFKHREEISSCPIYHE